jgi:hypothetical protein
MRDLQTKISVLEARTAPKEDAHAAAAAAAAEADAAAGAGLGGGMMMGGQAAMLALTDGNAGGAFAGGVPLMVRRARERGREVACLRIVADSLARPPARSLALSLTSPCRAALSRAPRPALAAAAACPSARAPCP